MIQDYYCWICDKKMLLRQDFYLTCRDKDHSFVFYRPNFIYVMKKNKYSILYKDFICEISIFKEQDSFFCEQNFNLKLNSFSSKEDLNKVIKIITLF